MYICNFNFFNSFYTFNFFKAINNKGIFINNNRSKASGAFSGNDLALSNSVLGVTETNIYANVGIANIKATNNFTLAKLPSSSNIGYVYYKWGSNANDSAIPRQNYNYN